MKKLKLFEDFSEFDTWEEIQSAYDVYQLYELIVFKYGEVLKDTKQQIDEYEEDYNPDHIYEIIEYELKDLKIWDDFLKNYQKYAIEKDESDPFHWRYRKKHFDNLSNSMDKWNL